MLYVVAVPQLMVWPLYTMVVGFVGAGAVYLVTGGLRSRRPDVPVEMNPAPR